MLYRKTYIADNQGLGDAGTRTFDINARSPITAIWLKFQLLNGATSNLDNTLPPCITAIEVIDGADVLYSLTGTKAFALAAQSLGFIPRQGTSEVGGGIVYFTVPVMFGRFLGDQEYAFDPTKFTNPQLRITWNLNAVRPVALTAFATTTLQVTAVAHLMDGASTPSHFLMAKEQYSWTSVAAGTEFIDMPTDYPWRGMILRGVAGGQAWHWMYDQLRLNCDGGQFIVMNERGWDLINQISMQSPRLHYNHAFLVHNGALKYTVLGDQEQICFTSYTTGDMVIEYSPTGNGRGTTLVVTGGGAQVADVPAIANVTGYNPYDCLYLPFGRQELPADWFPATTFKGVKFEVRGGVNDALMSVALVQDRTY